jgi:hypothetical protein
VQVDGARLEIYGDFEAQRQPPRPSKTEYAVLATAIRIGFMQKQPTARARRRQPSVPELPIPGD